MKNRKANRLKGFDYSRDALYFITSCCLNHECHFGEVVNGSMILNEFGKIAREQIEWMQNQYLYLKLHGFVVMPNHVHILMEIKRNAIQNDVGTGRDLSLPNLKIKSVSSIMGAYKTTTSKNIRDAGNFEFQWQRSFHDVIVRNENAYRNFIKYMEENPKRWGTP